MTTPSSNAPPFSWKPHAGRALEAALNRALALDPDTSDGLRMLDGRRVALALEGSDLALELRVDGERLAVGPVAADATPDLSVRSSLGALVSQLPSLLGGLSGRDDAPPVGRMHLSGDADLARRLQRLAERFDPDWQKPFATVFGDVLGVQIANAVAAGLRRARVAGGNLAQSAAEYVTEESRDVIPRTELDAFHDDVDALRDDAGRLAARVARLRSTLAATPGGNVKSGLRAWRIGRVLLRYRLDDLLDGTPAERWLRLMRPFVPKASAAAVAERAAAQSRGARLRHALQELGPIFVKFGQILSTRRDLVPPDVAEELTLLQDRVAPFDGETARFIVEQSLGLPVTEAFSHFDTKPLASASIAQVHAATLPAGDGKPGREVVVKVLRPQIERQIADDIGLLRSIAGLVDRTHPAADKIRPREIVKEVEATLAAELDLPREGANASVLRRFWLGPDGQASPDLYVPEVIWSHTAERVLTLERVHGIPSDDIKALDEAGIDRKALAAKGVRVFYTQVFRDNFFHADAHAGNIWVDDDPARRDNPRFIALDFGIMGQLSSEDQYYLAENFMAIFNRDYRRIAELHVQAGWMPAHIRIDELEAAARSVCEPYFTRPLSEISLAEVLIKLFRTAQRYELTLQPQLILLQKTLLNIEGVGRLLDPKLDIWAVARPVLEKILVERYSPTRLASEFRKRLPEMITHAPDMPRLLHGWLTQQVEGKHELRMRSHDLAELARVARDGQRRTVAAILGTGLLIVAAVLYALEAGGPRLLAIPAAAWIAGLGGLWSLLAAWPRRRKSL